jgi:hypothetical protein
MNYRQFSTAVSSGYAFIALIVIGALCGIISDLGGTVLTRALRPCG